jgi:hypothetical protein
MAARVASDERGTDDRAPAVAAHSGDESGDTRGSEQQGLLSGT